MPERRNFAEVQEDLDHAAIRVKILAQDESRIRIKKRRAFKEMYSFIDELALCNNDKRKND